jgi:RepB DNA-primase from phage plasmid
MYNCSMDRDHVFCQEGDTPTRAKAVDIGPSLTRNAVEGQLGAMNSGLYEVGLFRAAGDGRQPDMLPRTWDRQTLVQSLFWLRWENSQGRNIFIRPAGEHHLSLVDDLAFAAIRRMKLEGFAPAVVVETSPGNFQAWLNHGEMLEKELSTTAARALAQRFGGDPGAADWRHFGRLAGFTNRKSNRRQDNGLYPFVHLIEWTGIVYSRAGEFVAQLRKEVVNQAEARALLREQLGRLRNTARESPRLTIDDFRLSPKYQGDGNRIDLAYAIYALSHNVPEEEIRAAIGSRDLRKKGLERRQRDYINRTLEKARTLCGCYGIPLDPTRGRPQMMGGPER